MLLSPLHVVLVILLHVDCQNIYVQLHSRHDFPSHMKSSLLWVESYLQSCKKSYSTISFDLELLQSYKHDKCSPHIQLDRVDSQKLGSRHDLCLSKKYIEISVCVFISSHIRLQFYSMHTVAFPYGTSWKSISEEALLNVGSNCLRIKCLESGHRAS